MRQNKGSKPKSRFLHWDKFIILVYLPLIIVPSQSLILALIHCAVCTEFIAHLHLKFWLTIRKKAFSPISSSCWKRRLWPFRQKLILPNVLNCDTQCWTAIERTLECRLILNLQWTTNRNTKCPPCSLPKTFPLPEMLCSVERFVSGNKQSLRNFQSDLAEHNFWSAWCGSKKKESFPIMGKLATSQLPVTYSNSFLNFLFGVWLYGFILCWGSVHIREPLKMWILSQPSEKKTTL